jgi:anti-anti-sigma factor
MRTKDGILIVDCVGRIVFGDESSSLRETVKKAIAENNRIVLNLADVSYIDSGGLGTLVALHTTAQNAGGAIKLANLTNRVDDLLQVTKLLTVFVLSLGWRQAGIKAVAIMNAPYRSVSVGEFWGRRWNLAFRDLAHVFVFRPLVGTWGVSVATMAVFLASGLIHDLVISGAAGARFGGPTLYFLIQAAGLFIERSRLGKRVGLGRGCVGWMFCAIVTLGPVGLLFHRPFIERVAVPMFRAFGLI